MTVYSVLASFSESHSQPKLPFVATCTWVDEQLRATALINDILMIGGTVVANKPLLQRVQILNDEIVRRLRSEMSKNEQSILTFAYKPFAELKHAKKLVADFDKFCCRPEELAFIPAEGSAGHRIVLPISTSILLHFDYNRGQKALLLVSHLVHLSIQW